MRRSCVALGMLCLVAAPLAAALAADDEKPKAPEVRWTDVRELGVEGQGWTDTKAPFDRLPGRAEGVVRPPVWGLSRQSAGLCVRFATDSPTIQARWTLTSNNLALPHMPATGVSGLDLYVQTDHGYRWLGAGRPEKAGENTATLIAGLPRSRREYLLYLPLYNGVKAVSLGVPEGFAIEKAPPRGGDRSRPIVFYGTSITQGGCASRPGMVHTAILGRRLDRAIINLGFSGNGRMEPEMAKLLAELDPVVYVLDCLPNMNAAEVAERVEPFVKTLRAAHPDTPIVLADDRSYSNASIVAGSQRHNAANRAALRQARENLERAGVKGCSASGRRPARLRTARDRRRLAPHRPRLSPHGRCLRAGAPPGARPPGREALGRHASKPLTTFPATSVRR
ncbi:MAG: SGNH/GDSL hydrolase family protein [Isosphaeraceae bacterium]